MSTECAIAECHEVGTELCDIVEVPRCVCQKHAGGGQESEEDDDFAETAASS